MAASDDPRPASMPSRADFVAGTIFVAVAAVFGWEATDYEMGQLVAMGPGFVPLSLSVMLAALGIALALFGRNEGVDASSAVPWRGMALVCVSLVIFGAYVRDVGLLPTVFVCAFLTALASSQNSIVSAASIAWALSALCWLVFKVGLGISVPLIGSVFGSFQVY